MTDCLEQVAHIQELVSVVDHARVTWLQLCWIPK